MIPRHTSSCVVLSSTFSNSCDHDHSPTTTTTISLRLSSDIMYLNSVSKFFLFLLLHFF